MSGPERKQPAERKESGGKQTARPAAVRSVRVRPAAGFDRSSLRGAVIWSELLAPPLALRKRR